MIDWDAKLYGYQKETVSQARELIKQGHKNILIVSPTGSGKTVIATHMTDIARAKQSRVAFVVDRLSLIQQTSRTFFDAEIDHGVIQADHPMYHPWKKVQICSQQTLSRRKWPDADIIFVDEAHTVTETVKKRITPRDTVTIGLTATPFTKGLGKHYDAIVNVTTTNKLIASGNLSNYRIFAASEPDMTGVKVVAGEWDRAETEKRALEVVGDCVAEYLKLGEGKKFICSAVDVNHVMELQRQFMAAGIVCATYTYKDLADDRADIVAEFRKPDSNIRGLITVTAASKGFDVPDIGVVIMARPMRKSLAEHIQFFGRGLRVAPGKTECIARGTPILTHRGLIPIEKICITDTIWDGNSFVSHDGAICKGIQNVITYQGLTATPDHLVKTKDGWRAFGDCAREQIAIVQTGLGGAAIRECDHMFAGGGVAREGVAKARVRLLSLQHVFRRGVDCIGEFARWTYQRMQGLQPAFASAEVAYAQGGGAKNAMHESEGCAIRGLRWAWDSVQVRFGAGSVSVDYRKHWNESRPAIGQDQQRGALRAGEPSLVNSEAKHGKYKAVKNSADASRVSTTAPGNSLRRFNPFALIGTWLDIRENNRTLPQAISQAQREVWDILNCGPLHRFTAQGLLVHNCLVLDHSGNCKRFWNEWNDFFETGAVELDDGKVKKKEKKKPVEKEREMAVCPSCAHVHMALPHCPACGHEYPIRNTVQHVAGTLTELIASHNRVAQTSELWPQICYYAAMKRNESSAARKMALALFKQMTGQWPTKDYFDTEAKPISKEVMGKIKSMNIAYSHSLKARAKQVVAQPTPPVPFMGNSGPLPWEDARGN